MTKRSTVGVWNSGAPPKRGVYRVKCDGPNPNAGYRYWYGDKWSNLTRTYLDALNLRVLANNRNTPLKRAVLWWSHKPEAQAPEPVVAESAGFAPHYYDASELVKDLQVNVRWNGAIGHHIAIDPDLRARMLAVIKHGENK